jgi:poly-gamma-glutamate capsule biosynthesis protein CapA/YwtB (metallophosphatase superfamily)
LVRSRGRLLAAAFAVASVIASLVVVWLVAIDSDDAGGHSLGGERTAGSAKSDTDGAANAAGEAGGAIHFTVSASGDLLMHQPLLDRALANGNGDEYDFAPFFDRIKPYVAGVDLGLCHVETPMGPGPPTTYPIFNTPTGLASSIHRSGWDACDTASNHSLDGAQAGIDGTVKALHKANVIHTGSFASEAASEKPTIVEVEGVKIGYVAYTDATNGFTPPHSWSLNTYPAADPKAGAKAIIHDAREARDDGAQAVIVQLHWGDENSQTPNSSQVAVAKQLTDSKVITVVVGQGPHVVQPIERVHDKFVVFSEGNLVSNQAASTGLPTETEDGIVALLHFKALGDRVTVRRVTYVPTWVRLGDYVVLPAKPSADRSNASELSRSYKRTVAVVGRGDGFAPSFSH